ncbi:RNA 2',3'-cyclic phosphodiesterase [Myxosarcina sp. GI1]|uniref:RNA 2',3'-cyclic phosphodiesterase n=1 Tax=Myxosarcina sp. GI1 TaxID=1541065 RepID=UPI00055BC7D0|nr:RNA 2',3'-cyclic phosphodiesterase [Myxosarcina sp. GI1]
MSDRLRLFVGVFPSLSTQQQLRQKAENYSQKLKTKVRILAPELLHLTIEFIGEVDATQLNDLTKAFLKAKGKLPAASLQIKQLMLFPSHRKPRVVAAAVERSPELDFIFQFFNEGFSDLGIIAERRSFIPHITVARSRHWQKETIFLTPFQLVEPVASVALVSSQLSPKGAKYEILASVWLQNA